MTDSAEASALRELAEGKVPAVRVDSRGRALLAELARIVNELGRYTAAACAWPQCGNYVVSGDPFCAEHWYRLPYGHREAVRAALEWVRSQPSAVPPS